MSLQISRILHAGYVFDYQGTRVVFDPIFENPFSRNCHAFPPVAFDRDKIRQLRPDAVFISHFHDDHCSLDSLDLLDRQTPIYLYCLFDELFAMIRALGFTQVHSLATDVPVQIGAIHITPRRALDDEVDSLFHIQAGKLNVLNVVDAWIDPSAMPQLASFAPWDMVLWPFQTMRETDVLAPSRASPAPATLPQEWMEQLAELKPRYVVPSSCQFEQEPWSWYNHALFPVTYQQFAREVGAALPLAQVIRLNPSVSVRLDESSLTSATPLDWVIPVGGQDLDYQYDPALKQPHTSEIARHFAALNAVQTERVLSYCRDELPVLYRDAEALPDSFFEQPRQWRLTVYDHTGAAQDFHYRLDGDEMTACDGRSAPNWTTEVPLAKLYSALETGESLTSMYMRINDAVFDADTERDLELADLVDDPLIRCLFNEAFGAYQAEQLKRLLAHG